MMGPTDPTTSSSHQRQPAGAASAPPQGTEPVRPAGPVHDPSAAGCAATAPPSLPVMDPAAAALGPRASPLTPRQSDGRQRTDRRTALAHHLRRRTDDLALAARPTAAGTVHPPRTDREAKLTQSSAALQRRCAALAADLAAAQARQGPLLQRLLSARRAFAELLSPPPDGASPSLSLHALSLIHI